MRQVEQTRYSGIYVECSNGEWFVTASGCSWYFPSRPSNADVDAICNQIVNDPFFF